MAFSVGFQLDYSRFMERMGRLFSAFAGDGMKRVVEKGAMLAFSDSQLSFLRQADPVTGHPWPPSKRALRQHGQTLRDTGRLMRSVVGISEVEKGGKARIMVGVYPLVYARIHQFGGFAGRELKAHIPQRRYAGISRKTAEQIAELLHREVSRA